MKMLRSSLAALVLLLVGQAALAQSLTVEEARVRAVPPVATTTAAFMRLANAGERSVRVVGSRSPAAETVELHRSEHREGVMTMRRIPDVTIPPGSRLELAPGGLHLMLIGLVAPLEEGDEVTLFLELDDGESLRVVAPVKAMGSAKMSD